MVRKNNSRQSDRNKIFKFHAQGYSVTQIAGLVGIHEPHIEYVLNHYEDDLRKRKAASPELQERARIQKEVESKRANTGPANDPQLAAIKAQLRAEIMAELKAETPAPAEVPEEPDEYVPIEIPGDEFDAPVAEKKPTPRRKQKAA